MVKIVVKKNMDGAYYALAYDGEDILFKTNLFDTAAGARKEAVDNTARWAGWLCAADWGTA